MSNLWITGPPYFLSQFENNLFFSIDNLQRFFQGWFFVFERFGQGIIGLAALQVGAVTPGQQADFLLVGGIDTQSFTARTFRRAGQQLFGAFQSNIENRVIAAQRLRFIALFQVGAKLADIDLNSLAEIKRQREQAGCLFGSKFFRLNVFRQR